MYRTPCTGSYIQTLSGLKFKDFFKLPIEQLNEKFRLPMGKLGCPNNLYDYMYSCQPLENTSRDTNVSTPMYQSSLLQFRQQLIDLYNCDEHNQPLYDVILQMAVKRTDKSRSRFSRDN